MERSLPPLGSYWRGGSTDQIVCVRDGYDLYGFGFVIFSLHREDGLAISSGQMTLSYLYQKYRQLSGEELALFLLKKENHEETY